MSVISTHPTEHVMLLQSGRQRKKAVMMPRVVLTPLKVNGEHVPSGENHWEQCVEEQHKTKGQKVAVLSKSSLHLIFNYMKLYFLWKLTFGIKPNGFCKGVFCNYRAHEKK